ncbi:hypothetical protein HanXRQr2_Chr11g0496001 [Helianthus annuus]|uniref:Uncharacterized protein n=1 Tax=Helianthus annuus TaxID=4232 RepID=A0A9K3HPS8_HELAN|nr:hypothetical protein HanXRQr2_Chr11g0496001 [Helianthus annuus]KAJ0501932.1 hypothetical protein HanHA300_Chr11g0406791 [Helianthus annuus]KAJ0509870.1 hypothetical protein HanIR_Chr11g0534061 [Helianthus annuus]KAJ0517860.1 hypothetical protein HanHA89_Chr11g0430531 [Helianthus annuus]KAJ0685876.1 hypothetical protein HanLR1_Chr11g0408021 [Helianthus annuus]
MRDETPHIEGLYLPTITWDPRMPDKPYKPHWKIVESTCLIYPQVINHWVDHAFPPVEVSYVKGQDSGPLLDSTLADAVAGVKRIAEIKRCLGQDNRELQKSRHAVQQMLDDIQRRDSLLEAAKARESRLLAEKEKAKEDLKRVTSNLAEEHVVWAQDIQEKERVIAHALKVQVELERKAVLEAEKEHHHSLMAEMEDTQAKLDQANQGCDEVVVQRSQLQRDLDVEKSRRAKSENAMNHALAEAQELSVQLVALKDERSWWVSHGVTSCFEFLRRSPHFSSLLDDMATTAYETGQHDGMHAAYFECGRLELVTDELRSATASASTCMAETLSAVANDPLPKF